MMLEDDVKEPFVENCQFHCIPPDTPSLPVYQKYVLTTPLTLKGNSLKRCMLAYCHMEIHIHCVIMTVWSERFEGVIALFDLK